MTWVRDGSPRFSVVIPTYNRRATLLACLAALERQTLPHGEFEVIVAVDGSTDGTAEAVGEKDFSFSVRCIVLHNGGASKARNAGVAASQGEYIALTEDDVIPEEDWLSRAAQILKESTIDVLEGRTVYEDTRRDVRRMDAAGIPSFIPCNLFVRRSVFLELGGYDPAFFDAVHHLYFREDADFGFRVLQRGYRVAIAPEVVAAHPQQFSDLGLCIHHARRYVFDPLLYRKHPIMYRRMIEVKTIFGLTVHRPQHLVAWVSALALVTACITAAQGEMTAAIVALLCFAVCGQVFRWKYQGAAAFRFTSVGETLGFMAVPLVYLYAVVKGCLKFRVIGPLV